MYILKNILAGKYIKVSSYFCIKREKQREAFDVIPVLLVYANMCWFK